MAPVTPSSTFLGSKDLSEMRAIIGGNDVQLGGFCLQPDPEAALSVAMALPIVDLASDIATSG